MNLNRFELAGILASIALVLLAGVFALSQTAFADDTPVDPCGDIFSQLPGMGCDDEGGGNQTPVDPCEITPCNDEGPSLGEQITCEVYEELVAQGEPIPQGFDASGCDGESGGGDDEPACSDGVDNDNDGAIDSEDPGCSGADDDDETNTGGGGGGNNPACKDGQDNDNDGKTDMDDPGCTDENDTDENDGSSGGGGGGGSGGGGGGGGSVAGTASTTCDTYLTAFIKFGQKNDEEQVKRLQHVLKTYEGAEIEENGVYDAGTLSAVHAFQTKYWDTILAPWNIKQSTGFVYLTTRKKVNEIYCKNEVMFPLSEEENAVIEAAKKPGAVAGEAVKPETKPAEKPATKAETKNTEKKAEEQAEEGATKRSGWGAVGDFFKRLFNRGR